MGLKQAEYPENSHREQKEAIQMTKKGRRTRVAGLLLAVLLCVSLFPLPASAADSGVRVWSDKIGSNTAKVATIEMRAGRTGTVSLANNSVVESASAQSLINAKNTGGSKVVAAIDGGFFNAYSKGAAAFPNNCQMLYNAVVVDGKLVHSGNTNAIGFTADGKAMVDWVKLGHVIRLGNGNVVGGSWGMNTYQKDPGAIMLFDEHLTLPVDIPSSSAMCYIRDGRVTQIVPGSTLRVPAGTYVLVYNAEVAKYEQDRHRFPEVGMSAEILLTASGTDRDQEWLGVRDALVGGPVLVKDGKNVAKDSRNDAFYVSSDSKQGPDKVLARAFVGVTWSGSLVMGTVTASFTQIADWMVKIGLKEGLAMDGGASSMLYANGGFVTKAGRNLASVLTIVDRPDDGWTSPNVGVDNPTGWAVGEVQTAIAAGLVPENIQRSYRSEITRQDFCRLIWELVKKQPKWNELLWGKGEVTFSDVYSDEVRWCAQLGIVSGMGDGKFAPYRSLKRAEAAKILALTVQLLGGEDSGEQYPFSDRGAFPSWDQGWIDFCGANQIMNGVGGGRFDPDGTFTREQAIVTILRIHQRYSRK